MAIATLPPRLPDDLVSPHGVTMISMKSTALAIAFASMSISANSAVISFEAPLNLETTEINQNLGLGMFNATLGTLDSISLELFGQAISTASIQNNARQPQRFGFTSTLSLLFSGSTLDEIVQLALFNTSETPLSQSLEVSYRAARVTPLLGQCPAALAAPGSVKVTLPAFGFAACILETDD